MARLDEGERALLLRVARQAVLREVAAHGATEAPAATEAPTAELARPRGAFVTLKRRERPGAPEELRGCVGRMEAEAPLVATVAEMAVAAASRDGRFPPLTADELPGLRIEISVLGEPREIDGPGAIVIGRDGVVLRKGPTRAVFLPQVGAERGWSPEQLLQHLARKAGFDAGGWVGAELSVFEAEVFAEPPAPEAS